MIGKVLITGASGFIGQNCLVPLLNEGFDVYACCRKKPECVNPDVNYIECDLLDSNAQFNMLNSISVSHLLHLAWYVEPGEYLHSSKNLEWLSASINLIKTFGDLGGKRIVTAGTCAEYEWSKIYGDIKIDELFSTQNNSTLYSAAKSSIGMLTNTYMRECGLSCAHGRVFYLYGPGEKKDRLVPQMFRNLKAGDSIELQNGRFIRDYLYVKDVANAFVSILASTVDGAVNIGSGEGISLSELVGIIKKVINKDGIINSLNTNSNNDPECIIADNAKLRSIGWNREYSHKRALEEYISLLENEG